MSDPDSRIAPEAPVPLAGRDDFRLGQATVQPSLRTVIGPGGPARGEPRVMQVLVTLADARGKVLSREDLLRLCWDGRIVGDDAINRAVAEVRRIAETVGAGFGVETVPRVGYRLSGIDWESGPAAAEAGQTGLGRRKLLAAGTAALLALGAGGGAILYRSRHSETDALIERGRVLQASGTPGEVRQAEALFRQALQRNPQRADAWGWLASVLDRQDQAREAAQRALMIDPREPNARTVLAFQRWDLDAWTHWEDTLLGVLADAPGNASTLGLLTFFYQGMGRCLDSWNLNERAIQAEPFNPTHEHRRALKHWIFGRTSEADKVADQAMRLWPRHPTVWNARMIIYAFTDRASAALALLDDVAARPANLTAPSIESWRAGLTAIATRSRRDIDRALGVYTSVAGLAPGLAANAIMVFSHLGELDSAYLVAAGLFEGRGSVVQRSRGAGIADTYSGSAWGRSQFLFIPATAPFRADPRFPDLCRRTGHLAYWQRRNVWPDPFVRGAIDPAKLA